MMTRTSTLTPALILAAAALWGASASAQAPPYIPVQGSLYDDMGEPINETLPVEFALYADDEGSVLIYGETTFVTFEGGFFTSWLGPVDLSTLDGPGLFLGINVDGDGEMDLIPIGTVPFAAWAQNSANAAALQGLSLAEVYTGARNELGALDNTNPYHHNRYSDAEARTAMGTAAAANPLNHDRYSDSEARAAMGAAASANPLNHERYTNTEAVGAMGPTSDGNPLNHTRFTSAEARDAMGGVSNGNTLNHTRYSDAEARAAMGTLADSNDLNHNRYTDAEAQAANNGRFASTTHEHVAEGCSWTAYGCGALQCGSGQFMAGMQALNNGNNEQCYGSGDYDEPARRILCCSLGNPRN